MNFRSVLSFFLASLEFRSVPPQKAGFTAPDMFSELMSFSSIVLGVVRPQCAGGWMEQLQIFYLK